MTVPVLASPTPWHWVHRILLSVLGAYAFTWGLGALVTVALVAAGLSFHEAEHAVHIGAFLIYLAAFLWAFASPALGRVWMVFGAGGAALLALSLIWQHGLLA